jgi:tetratricopeptide (TPR) repeat protein
MLRVPYLLVLSTFFVATTALAQTDDTATRQAPAAARHYALTLLTSFDPIPANLVPKDVNGLRVYRTQHAVFGQTIHYLRVGFFPGPAEAEAAMPRLHARYPMIFVSEVTPDEVAAGGGITVQAMPAAPKKPVETPLDKQATVLMDRGRAALTRGDNLDAIRAFNELLNLPPNIHSQDAQELIGLAYERNSEVARAKKEYALYLKLYPDGEGAERVRQRLANLESPGAVPVLKKRPRKEVDVTTAYGSLSQYYYRGEMHMQAPVSHTGPVLNQPALDTIDQSALISTLDLTGRIRSGDYDNRVVIRDTYVSNYLPDADDYNRLYSAYFEIKDKALDYSFRLGRQPGVSGGVLGRFDGATAGYNFLPTWRVNVIAGQPVEFYPVGYTSPTSSKQFWGTGLDLGTFAGHWNSSVYYFNQTVDGILDRQAVGTELRYFSPTGSMMGLVDYDVSYSVLNIAMLQGNWQMTKSTSWNLLVDHRNAPTLQTSNALNGEAVTSISALLLTLSESEIRALAVDRTPTASLEMLGITHNLNPVWQIGADVKHFNFSGTPASGSLPAIPGTGDIYIYTAQTIASGLFSRRDISVLSLSAITGLTYDGISAAISNRSILRDRWTADVSLRYYTQTDNLDTVMQRYSPTLRIGYRWRDRVTFEVEAGIEKTHSDSGASGGPVQDDTRNFYMLGYRWDF